MSFNHLVDIETFTSPQNSTTGEIAKSWTVWMAGVFCSIEPLSVKDYIQSRADQSEISVRIVIPFLRGLDSQGDVKSTMRIVAKCGCHEGKIYNPKGVLEDPNTGQEYVTLPCSQGVNNG